MARIREQLKGRFGGANDARIICVVTASADGDIRIRPEAENDVVAASRARKELQRREGDRHGCLSVMPDERISLNEIRRISVPIYGMEKWGDLFTSRQGLALATIASLIQSGLGNGTSESELGLERRLKPAWR